MTVRPLLACLVAALFAGDAAAAWSVGGGGGAATRAHTLQAGATPAVAAQGRTVTLQWAATRLPNGADVGGYVVRRYDANSVPTGTWRYTVAPALGGWRGGESAPSAAVVVR